MPRIPTRMRQRGIWTPVVFPSLTHSGWETGKLFHDGRIVYPIVRSLPITEKLRNMLKESPNSPFAGVGTLIVHHLLAGIIGWTHGPFSGRLPQNFAELRQGPELEQRQWLETDRNAR